MGAWDNIYGPEEYKSDAIDAMEDEIIRALEYRGFEWRSIYDAITELATRVIECDITYDNAIERAFALCA